MAFKIDKDGGAIEIDGISRPIGSLIGVVQIVCGVRWLNVGYLARIDGGSVTLSMCVDENDNTIFGGPHQAIPLSTIDDCVLGNDLEGPEL